MSDRVKVRSITERVGEGDDAQVVTASYGEEVPEGISGDRLKALRDLGAIASSGDDASDAPAPGVADRSALDATGTGVNPEGGAEGVTGPGDSGGSSSGPSAELPDDAPDAAQADVGELSRYIDSESLNAAQTVALAEGDPELAAKVLEAERAAQGGDARATVERPLSKLAAKAGGGDTPPAEPPAA
jgi:hypothetical protein